MKRIIGLLIDIIFFISFVGVTVLACLYFIFSKERDISIINVYLQTELVRSMLFVYIGFTVLYFVYYWLLPTLFKQTIGQRLAGTMYESEKKITLWRVFLKTIIGRFWDLVLFPYTIFVSIKKRPIISTRLSGIAVIHSEVKPTKALYVATFIFTFYLMMTLAAGTYVYKTGLTPLMEKYTNYEKQVVALIDKLAYQDASVSLAKYKQYHGEDSNYSYFLCLIEANLNTELTSLETCKKAQEANATDLTRVKSILIQEAKIYAANDMYKEAEALYVKLWNDYQDRSIDMKNYVVVLSELGKGKEATEVLNEIAKLVPTSDVIAQRDLANLYERIGNIDLAFQKYKATILLIPEGENQMLAGELYYNIGVIYYTKGKYTEATASFEKAKELNKDFAEPVESYIILISKLKNSVTK